jgi:hypothetical protein
MLLAWHPRQTQREPADILIPERLLTFDRKLHPQRRPPFADGQGLLAVTPGPTTSGVWVISYVEAAERTSLRPRPQRSGKNRLLRFAL